MKRIKLSDSFKKRVIRCTAGLVAFTTAYSLILPAITIDQDTAEEDPGIVLTEEDNVNAETTYTETEVTVQEDSEPVEEAAVEETPEPVQEEPEQVVEETVPAETKQEEVINTQQEQVQELLPVAGELSCESKEDYVFKTEYDETLGLTEKAQLEIKEVLKEDDYINYLEALKNQIDEKLEEDNIDKEYEFAYARFFNVYFLDNNAYKEINGKTENTYTFHEPYELEDNEELKVYCIDNEGKFQEYNEENNKLSFKYKDKENEEEKDKIEEISFEDKEGLNNFTIVVIRTLEEEEASEQTEEQVTEEQKEDTEETTEITEEESPEDTYTSGTLTEEGKDYTVTLSYTEEAKIPEGSRLYVREIIEDSKTHNEYLTEAEGKIENISYARFFDISILDKEGNETEPSSSVDVRISIKDAPEADDIKAVHFTEEETQIIDTEKNEEEVSFTAESFSVYGVVYTVDFHYEVDGKMYEYSIPGGSYISLEHLVEVLNIYGTDTEVNRFIKDVETVEFSSPELIWLGKVTEDTTVGDLVKENDLDLRYSAELTEEQISDINDAEIMAGDWIIVSQQPFDTEESLMITMKNGDQWTVKVTDDQISNFGDLVSNERYVLYIDVNGTYYALDNTGNTVQVPDNDLDVLSSEYLWRFTSQENGSNQYDNASSWLSGGNYLDVYWPDKEKPVVSAANSDNWVPIVTLIPNGDGYYFRDLNPDNLGRDIYWNTNYQIRVLKDLYDSNTDTHNLRTTINSYYYDFFGYLHGDPYSGAATIHVYKQGSAHTVIAQSNSETYGHVHYTEGSNTQQTTSSHTSLEVLTENNVEKNKTVPGTFTAVPERGYKFTGWEVIQVNSWDAHEVTDWGEGATSESATIHPTVSGDLILEANFAPEKLYPFTVNTNDDTMGTVGGGNEEGSNVAGQTSFTSISGVVIDGTGTNAFELSAVQKPLHKFVAWELKSADGQVIQTITTQNIPAHSIELTEDGMILTAVFRKKTETEIDEGDIDTLLGSWKTDMTSDFVGVDKTAHVYDPENRIYEIDLGASSGKWAVENSINLDFITDTSRSMYFPANLEYAKGSEAASSFTSLKDWLEDNGTIGETYYVISNDNTATMYAVHYDGGWKFRDASYYYYWTVDSARSSYAVPDGLTATGQPLNGKTLTGVIYKSRTAPSSYQGHSMPTSLSEYWSRLDYLYKAVMTATETLKAIDPQAAVHLTTFNKASKNEGWIVKSTDSPLNESQIFSSNLTKVTPDGGTRQDEGLYSSRTGENRGGNAGPGNTQGVGTNSPFADSSHRHFAILVTDGAPNGAEWGNANGNANNTIYGQAKRLKAITDDNSNPLTLMTLGISLNFVNDVDRTNLANISSDSSKYAKAANNGGQIVTAIEELVESMVAKAAMRGTVSDTLDPAFYPVKSDGTPITEGYYTMNGDPYSPKANDTSEYCQWTRNGDVWTVTYYNQTFKWPTRDTNGNITKNGWNQAFYAKAKENFMGGNAIETNDVGSTTFTATHTILIDSQGNLREDTKKEIVDNLNNAKPISKSDIPTPHVNVKQLTLTENSTEWKIYVQTGVEPLPQIKALYDNIMVQEVVDSSTDYMITNKSAMLFNPAKEADPETFYLKDVFGDSSTIDWTTLTAAIEEGDPPAYVDLPYNNTDHNYGHNTGYIRLTLKKEGDTANYDEHPTSSNLNDVETYVLSAQFIPYTISEMIGAHEEATSTHDHSYHTTPQQSPCVEQMSGKPSSNTHKIDLFVRGLGITKTNETFSQGLAGAEFTVYRPATEEEAADNENEIKTFEGDTGKYIFDRNLTFDNNGVAFVNGVRSLTPPKTTYYLLETKAPDGYILREEPIRAVLEITNEYTPLPVAKGVTPSTQTTKPTSGMYNWVEKASLTLSEDSGVMRTTGAYDPDDPATDLTHTNVEPSSLYEVMYYRISNNPGVVLPATGGSGTNLIYLLGAILTVIASAAMVMKRRRQKAL